MKFSLKIVQLQHFKTVDMYKIDPLVCPRLYGNISELFSFCQRYSIFYECLYNNLYYCDIISSMFTFKVCINALQVCFNSAPNVLPS